MLLKKFHRADRRGTWHRPWIPTLWSPGKETKDVFPESCYMPKGICFWFACSSRESQPTHRSRLWLSGIIKDFMAFSQKKLTNWDVQMLKFAWKWSSLFRTRRSWAACILVYLLRLLCWRDQSEVICMAPKSLLLRQSYDAVISSFSLSLFDWLFENFCLTNCELKRWKYYFQNSLCARKSTLN